MHTLYSSLFRKVLILSFILLLLGLVACDLPGNKPSTPTGSFEKDQVISEASYTFETLSIPAGVTVTLEKATQMTVTGNVSINGNLIIQSGKLTLEAQQDLTLNGSIDMPQSASLKSQQDSSASFKDSSSGLFIVVKENMTVSKAASIKHSGPLVFTDSLETLNKTPEEINAEAESASGEQATLVPLPPSDPVFNQLVPATANIRTQQVARRTIQVSGTVANFSDLPATTPVYFRFDTPETDITLSDWEIIPTRQVNGEADDNTADADKGKDARAKDGKKAANLLIHNNQGSLSFNNVTINLGNGGNGGAASVNCATARAGNGKESGNFRATARDGINLSGPVTINPGRSGDGGAATATGDGSCAVSAIGGQGADNEKRLYSRGNVTGLENLTITALDAGNGGAASATTIGQAANGSSCGTNGKKGGKASATAGDGGDASLAVSNAAIGQGVVQGGDAGNATATAGDGGDGGDCTDGKKGGNGGDGGEAVAKAGDGGKATSAGGAPSVGAAGNATATAGQAGRGGHSCGNPKGTGGTGGDGGKATANAGLSGSGAAGTSEGRGGNGGNGGDGSTVGAGGAKGEGVGTPADIADGADGVKGKLCQAANQAPKATEDTASTQKETAVIIAVLSNDSDPDGDSMSVASVTQAQNGTTVKNADNTVTYTPKAGFIGSDSFTYNISDGKGGSASASVSVSVSDKPVETYSLNIFSEGGGSVSGTAGGKIAVGNSVGLSAVAKGGYEFDKWISEPSACTSSSPSCNFTMPAQDVTITAIFKPQATPMYTLTVLVTPAFAGAGGQVTGTNILSKIPAPQSSSATFAAGTTVTLSATPEANSVLDSWSVPCAGSSAATCDVTLNSDMTVNAVFTLKPVVDNKIRTFDAVGLFDQGDIAQSSDHSATVYKDDRETAFGGSVGLHVQDVFESMYFREGDLLYVAHGGFELDFSQTVGIVTSFKVQLKGSCSDGKVTLRGFVESEEVVATEIDASTKDVLEISFPEGLSEVYLEMDDSGSICLDPFSFSFTVQ